MSGNVVSVVPEPALLEYRDPATGQMVEPDASTAIVSSPVNGSSDSGSSGTSYPLSSLPLLNSDLGAKATLYLDFVGDYEATWGAYSQITTPAFDIDGNSSTFSNSELTAIKTIWSDVAEDFSMFNINVTTVAPPSLVKGVDEKIVIGGAGEWMGAAYGGISYIGSFTNDMPSISFVFSKNLADGNAEYTADAIAHEAGHDFGLYHQSTYSGTTLTQEYSTGPGNGTAPTMGCSYDAGRSLWWDGTSDISSTSYQDDMAVIASATNGFGYRPESAGTTASTATLLSETDDQISAYGVLDTGQDLNEYTVLAGVGQGSFTIHANVGYNDLVPTIQLYDATGTQLLASATTPSDGSEVTLTYNFSQSSGYRLVVRSDGSYGNAGQYWLSGTIVAASSALYVQSPSNLNASAASSSEIDLSWVDNSPNAAGYTVLRTQNGVNWGTVASNLPVGTTSFADRSVSPGQSYAYRVVAFDTAMNSNPSNTVSLTTPMAANVPPSSVSDLAVIGRSSNDVTLSWIDNSEDASDYEIQRSGNGGKSWSTVATVSAGSQTYSDRSVRASRHYDYRIVSDNSYGASLPSNLAEVITPRFAPSRLGHAVKPRTEATRATNWVIHSKAESTLAPNLRSRETKAPKSAQLFHASRPSIIPVNWKPVIR